MRKNKLFYSLMLSTLIFSMIFMLSGCRNEKQSQKDTLTVAVAADATSLDPTNYNDDYSENVMKQIFDTILVKQPDGKLENSLAESVVFTDDNHMQIKLKEGLKWSNGEDLTIDDVIYSLDRVANSDQYGYIFGSIDTASPKKIDEFTVDYALNKQDATIKEALAHPASSIVKQSDVEEKGDNFGQNPMGSGPFKLDSWTKLDSITLEKNENYWGDVKPSLQKIVMKVIPEANQRLIELESGSVDIAYRIAPNDIKKVEENQDLKLERKLDNSVHFVAFNVSKAPFDKIEAREAITEAIDMQTILKTVYMGVGKQASSPVNPNFSYSISENTEPFEYNPEKAKVNLESAGLVPGTQLKIYVNENQQRNDVAAMMQEQLKAYGIELEIVKLEWGALVEALKNKENDMFIMSWSPSAVDTHYEFYQPFHSQGMGKGPNFNDFSNVELDQLIEKGVSTYDDNERAEIYKQAQELVNHLKPWMYISYGETIVGMNKDIQNFELSPTYAQKLYTINFGQ